MESEARVKRKYTYKNKQKTLKDSDIYEDFVSCLLEENPEYFAIKAKYWDRTRTVFSLKEDTIKELKQEQREVFNKVYTNGFKRNKKSSKATKGLVAKLDEISSRIDDINKGKKLYYKVVDFASWKETMEALNFTVQDKLIEGKKYKITGIGYLEIVRVERSKASLLNPKYSYCSADDYILLRINKVCRFRNRQVYFARPTYGDPGISFKSRLFATLAKRPELKAMYKYISKSELSDMNKKTKERAERYKAKLRENGSL